MTLQRGPFVSEKFARAIQIAPVRSSRIVPSDADILVEREGIVELMTQLITELLVYLGNGIRIERLTHKEADRVSPFGLGKL